MGALAADRNTKRKTKLHSMRMKVLAATKIYGGSLVAVTSGVGYAIPATDTSGLIVMGVAAAQADNSSGASGDVEVEVETGMFKLTASSIVLADIGKLCYVKYDGTVALTGGTSNAVLVGKIVDIDADGDVWCTVEGLGG